MQRCVEGVVQARREAWLAPSARGPPLWEMPDAGKDRFDPQAQPAPDYEFDQRIACKYCPI